jgi:hypothetical protein
MPDTDRASPFEISLLGNVAPRSYFFFKLANANTSDIAIPASGK